MKVLVTGASGHLGRAVRKYFESDAAGDEFEPIYWTSPRAGDAEQRGYTIDIADPIAIDHEVRALAPDAVVHLAAITGAAADLDPKLTQRVNVDAVATLATAAAEAGATRFVFASTSAIYGDDYASPVSEDAPLNLKSSYAASKYAAEERLVALGGRSLPLQSVALRIFNIYGDEFADSLVSRLRASTPDRPVILRGLDSFVRDYVHADDVVFSIVAALRAKLDQPFTALNVAGGAPTSNRELVRVLGDTGPVHFEVVDGPASYSCAQISAARDLLGFSPRSLG